MKTKILASLIPLIVALSACGGSDNHGTPAGNTGSNNGGGNTSSQATAPTLAFTDPASTYDLNNYTQATMIPLQVGSGNNLLNDEASAVAFDTDTKTDLYIVGDGATSIVRTSLDGKVLDSMELNPGDFQDTEGVTYIGGGKMVLVEERLRQVSEFTYVAGQTLTRADVQTIKLGTTVGNVGIEGISFDKETGNFFGVRQAEPTSIFQFKPDWTALTATDGAGKPLNGSTDNPTFLFDAAKTGLSAFNDVYAVSNVLPANAPDVDNILITAAPDGKVEKLDRNGNIKSFLYMDARGQNEGVTMGTDGTIYLAGEQAAGPGKPGLTIFKPTQNASNVGIGSNLFLTFSSAVTAGNGKLTLSNGSDTREIDVTDPTQVTFSGDVAKIHPKYFLAANTKYSLTYAAGAFKLASGAAAAVNDQNSLSFSTIGTTDTTVPTLASSAPADGSTGITGNEDTLVFDKAVQAGAGSIQISGGSDARTIDVNDASQVAFNGPKMNLTLKTPLNPGTKYTVTLASGVVTDLYGNAFAGVTQTFTTAAAGASAPTVMITEVNSNALGPLPTDKAGKPSKQDFFELYNYGGSPIDLTGWKWGDNHADATDLNNTAAFAEGTVIAPGERIVVLPGVPGVNDKAFYTTWNLTPDIHVFAMENMNNDPANLIGLGGGDAVIVYDASGNVAASFNYGEPLTVNEGSGQTVTVPSANGGDPTLLAGGNHAGAIFVGGSASASAVWDGVSTVDPKYQAAAVGVLGGYAEPGDSASIGSPGK